MSSNEAQKVHTDLAHTGVWVLQAHGPAQRMDATDEQSAGCRPGWQVLYTKQVCKSKTPHHQSVPKRDREMFAMATSCEWCIACIQSSKGQQRLLEGLLAAKCDKHIVLLYSWHVCQLPSVVNHRTNLSQPELSGACKPVEQCICQQIWVDVAQLIHTVYEW